MHGNSKTRPRGIEIEEFLRSRMRRLKKANLDIIVPFSLVRLPSSGEGERMPGTLFVSRFIIPMMATGVCIAAQNRCGLLFFFSLSLLLLCLCCFLFEENQPNPTQQSSRESQSLQPEKEKDAADSEGVQKRATGSEECVGCWLGVDETGR